MVSTRSEGAKKHKKVRIKYGFKRENQVRTSAKRPKIRFSSLHILPFTRSMEEEYYFSFFPSFPLPRTWETVICGRRRKKGMLGCGLEKDNLS